MLAAFACAASVAAQSLEPTLFVATAFTPPGPYGGSVSSMRVLPDGTLEMAHAVHYPGADCLAATVSPDGRWLLVRVGVSPNVRLYEVHCDATFSFVDAFGALNFGDMLWLRDDLVAVGGMCFDPLCAPITLYRIDPDRLVWQLVSGPPGLIGAPFDAHRFRVHPSGEWFTVHSFAGNFGLFAVPPSDAPELGPPLVLGSARDASFLPDGTRMYSTRPSMFDGFDFDDGALQPLVPPEHPTGTLNSIGAAITADGAFIAVRSSHGHALCVQPIDGPSGAIGAPIACVTPGIAAFDGDIAAFGRTIFSTVAALTETGPAGILSLTVEEDGELVQNGPLHGREPEGVGHVPFRLALWDPRRARGGVFGDLDGDGIVDGADLGILLQAWGRRGGPADLDGSGVVDGADLGLLLAAWTLP